MIKLANLNITKGVYIFKKYECIPTIKHTERKNAKRLNFLGFCYKYTLLYNQIKNWLAIFLWQIQLMLAN